MAAGLILALLFFATSALAFDHGQWDSLLKKNVVVLEGGKASQFRYAEVDRNALQAYLKTLSGVRETEFKGWPRDEQIAFLINAYNAFAVEKVLSRYPDLRSIRDFGRIFGNPFKDEFFTLLGRGMSLDGVEHGLLRKDYREPRVHYAVNCASVGCPMLREEAYVADRLDAQLEEQARRFLSDRSRNRFDARNGTLEVSKIFDWYKEDWRSGYRGLNGRTPAIGSREQYFARYAKLLADDPAQQKLIEDEKASLAFLDYDWTLNDAKH